MTAKKNRIWKSGIVVTLLVVSALAGLLAVPRTEAATLTVPTDYATISAAITAASSGDTIVVLAGTYDISSEIKVSKTLTIRGQGDSTIINGGSTAAIIFNLTANHVNISNMKIQYATSTGINVVGNHCKIDNCTVSNCLVGIDLEGSADNAIIENSTISNNQDIGINVSAATVTIQYNTIEYNGGGSAEGGIIVQDNDTSNLTVRYNDIRYNNENGIYIYDDGENATEHANITVNYNNIYDNVKYGLNHQEATTNGNSVDAEDNWWGDPTGCYSPDTGTTYGYNRDASGDELNCPNVEVDYVPWLDAPWDSSGNYAHRTYNVWEGTTTVVHTYKEIYAALNSSNTANGDTINIRRGHYHLRTAAMNASDKCLLITDSITLRAMEPTGTNSYTYNGSHPDGADLTGSAPDIYILDAWETDLSAGTGDGIISITSGVDYVNITGFTIRRGGSNTYGIHVFNTTANYTHISNCIIELCESGIVFNGGQKPKIWNCTIRNNSVYGIKYLTGSYGIIANNTIEYNGDGTDNYGGIYLPNTDPYVAVVGNTIKNNDDDGIYIAKSTSSYESVIHYNNFRDNVVYGIETAGATVHAEYNCWYNTSASGWGGVPDAGGVDNISTNVNATPYYNGSVTNAWVSIATNGTATAYNAKNDVDIYAVFKENHTYDPFIMFAEFSALPIGNSTISGYTPFAKYLAFNISGRSATGLATGEWINVSVYYTTSEIPSGVTESTIKGIWHYNGSAWVKVSTTGKNTTNSGSYAGYVYANFSSNPTSPIRIVGNKPPEAKFTYSPSSPSVGEEISFDATSSSDSDGTISTYSWDFGDGESGVGSKPEHTYNEAGDYTVKLTVKDNAGDEDTYTKTITVTSAAPGIGVAPGLGDYDLTVSVVYSNGLPVENALVTLYAGNVNLATKFTDSTGKAVFNNVEGTYRVTAQKVGFKEAQQYVTVTEDTTVTLVIGKLAITQMEFMGYNMFEWFIIILLAVGFFTLLGFGIGAMEDRKYKKYWYIPFVFNLVALILAVTLPLVGLIAFSVWFVVIPLLLLFATIAVFWDELKGMTAGW